MYISVQNSRISFLISICIGGNDYVMELLKFVIHRTVHRFRSTEIRTVQFPYRTPTIWFRPKTPVRLKPFASNCTNRFKMLYARWYNFKRLPGCEKGALERFRTMVIFSSVAYSSTCMNSCLLNELEQSFDWRRINGIMENIPKQFFFETFANSALNIFYICKFFWRSMLWSSLCDWSRRSKLRFDWLRDDFEYHQQKKCNTKVYMYISRHEKLKYLTCLDV